MQILLNLYLSQISQIYLYHNYMKKLFLTVLAALSFVCLRAQNVEVNVLPIIEGDKETGFFTVNFVENFYVGWATPIDSHKDLGLKAFKSWELGFDIMTVNYKPTDNQQVRFAVNFGSRFFKTRHRNVIWNEGGYYIPLPFSAVSADAMNHRKRKSRLDVYELGAGLGYEIKAINDVTVGLDVICNYNFSAKSVTKYKEGSSKEKLKRKHWKTQKFTPEYRLTIGFPDIKLYVKVAPHELFQKKYGPKLSYISVGLIL